MQVYHPVYGRIKVPESRRTLTEYIRVARKNLEVAYDSRLEAYKDCLEERLDMFRRELA